MSAMSTLLCKTPLLLALANHAYAAKAITGTAVKQEPAVMMRLINEEKSKSLYHRRLYAKLGKDVDQDINKVERNKLPEHTTAPVVTNRYDDAELRTHDHVRIRGLTSEKGAEMNGQWGQLIMLEPSNQRWKVRMNKTGQAHYIKSENIQKDTSYAISGSLQPHDHVKIQGLTSNKGLTLNGQPGQLIMFDTSRQRWKVRMNSTGAEHSIKPENLHKENVHKDTFNINKARKKIADLTDDSDTNGNRPLAIEAREGASSPLAIEAREGASSPPAVTASEFTPGARVRIQGLQSKPGQKLNGQEGDLVTFDLAKGRWQVKINGIPKPKMIKLVNLVLLETSAPEPAVAPSTSAPEPADVLDSNEDYETIVERGQQKRVLKTSAAYRLLGLPINAPKRTIIKTHRKLMRKWLKTSVSSSGAEKDVAERMMGLLNDAKSVLIKDNLAAQYHTKNP